MKTLLTILTILKLLLLPLSLSGEDNTWDMGRVRTEIESTQKEVELLKQRILSLENLSWDMGTKAKAGAEVCPCPSGGKCICPADNCPCPNCPVHHGKASLRLDYEREVKALAQLREQLESQGEDSEAIARKLHAARRNLGEKYKTLTSENLRQEIYERNRKVYGDPLGPTIDWLRSRGKSWGEIAKSASEPGDWPMAATASGIKWKAGQPTMKGREVLFFSASWCANCPAAEERLGSLKSQIYYIDCSEDTPYYSYENSLAKKYGVTGYPYLLALDDGEVVGRSSGDGFGSYLASQWLGIVSESREPRTTAKASEREKGVRVASPSPKAPRVVLSLPRVSLPKKAVGVTFSPSLPRFSSSYSSSRVSSPSYSSGRLLSLSRRPGPSWNQPGDLRSHLITAHGYNPSQLSGLSYGQLSILKDNDHNSWGHGGHPYAGRSRSLPYSAPARTRTNPPFYQFQPQVYYSSSRSYGSSCPNGMCPR